ncbi:MAG: acyl-CoA dehydrogenase family protein [bacterium]|nr:acyl-CoA dehydrogenase family protein [bacterium]
MRDDSLDEPLADLLPRVRAAAERAERERRLPPELAAAMARAGVFRLAVPRALGGREAPVSTLLAVLEAIAHADGAAGWCAMIGATSAVVSAYLPEAEARAIWGEAPDVVTGGVFAPTGTAVEDGSDWRIAGRWRFASGCQHCDWLMGGVLVATDGRPQARLALFPAADARIIDTWDTAGLRGTGSHDIAVDDLRVPMARTVSLVDERPHAAGPLYAFPVFGLLALGIGAVALGIARRAWDELLALAGTKTPTGMHRPLAQRGAVQSEVAQATAELESARTWLCDTVGSAWNVALRGGALDLATRARLRLAATHATAAAARVTDRMYGAGGGTAIYAASPLQRCFRDVHVATQHMMVAQPTLELTGRVLLGVDADTSML